MLTKTSRGKTVCVGGCYQLPIPWYCPITRCLLERKLSIVKKQVTDQQQPQLLQLCCCVYKCQTAMCIGELYATQH